LAVGAAMRNKGASASPCVWAGHFGRFNGRRIAPWLLLMPILLLAACGQPGGYGRTEIGAGGYLGPSYAPTHYYPPPGPPDDPWGPYIREAAARYNVPEQWIRAVMRQESGGEEQAVSPAGAMGLMQVMPETYAQLQERYGLGADPFDPHNNILAGTAYIREMYDRFGSPGFLAAYNAGPERVDAYLAGAADLPNETQNYLAAVAPNLGGDVSASGPFATYAYAGGGRAHLPDAQSLAAGCDLNAAYDPNHPCSSLMHAATAAAPVQLAYAAPTGVGGCNLTAAYDPNHPCTSGLQSAASPPVDQPPPQMAAAAPVQPAVGCNLDAAYDPNHPCTTAGHAYAAVAAASAPSYAVAASAPPAPAAPAPHLPPRTELASAAGCDPDAAYDPDNPCREAVAAARHTAVHSVQARTWAAFGAVAGIPSAAAATIGAGAAANEAGPRLLAIPKRVWGIQVGAFSNPALARAVAEGAKAQAPGQLRAAAVTLPPVSSGGRVLYRARLVNLSQSAAADACTNLNRRGLPCVVVQPNRS
jgi:D-alanyl-D-alanine carboxypeptidase